MSVPPGGAVLRVVPELRPAVGGVRPPTAGRWSWWCYRSATRSFVTCRPGSPEERQDALGDLVGLREHRGAGLREDLGPGELDHLRRHVGVADAGLRSGQVLDRDVHVLDRVLEPVLVRTQVGAGGGDRLDLRVDATDRRLRGGGRAEVEAGGTRHEGHATGDAGARGTSGNAVDGAVVLGTDDQLVGRAVD